jgi:hypothetical protein
MTATENSQSLWAISLLAIPGQLAALTNQVAVVDSRRQRSFQLLSLDLLSQQTTSAYQKLILAIIAMPRIQFLVDQAQEAGAVIIIQDSLSPKTSEEGNRGSYQIVLLESDLFDDFDLCPAGRAAQCRCFDQARQRKGS